MNKSSISAQWGYLRMVLGNARRQIELIPEQKLDFRPTPEVRTIGELAVHMFVFLTDSTASVLKGEHVQTEEPRFTKKSDLLAWIDRQIKTGYENFDRITDEQIGKVISAWGVDFPGWQMLGFVFDEALHHRGQMTVYLRLLGIAPVFVYEFESAPSGGNGQPA